MFERPLHSIAYNVPSQETSEYIPEWLVDVWRTAQKLSENVYCVVWVGLPIKLRVIPINNTRVQDHRMNQLILPPTTATSLSANLLQRLYLMMLAIRNNSN